jgi:hypothetical protein
MVPPPCFVGACAHVAWPYRLAKCCALWSFGRCGISEECSVLRDIKARISDDPPVECNTSCLEGPLRKFCKLNLVYGDRAAIAWLHLCFDAIAWLHLCFDC